MTLSLSLSLHHDDQDTPQGSRMELLKLPPELLALVFELLDPPDLNRVLRTSSKCSSALHVSAEGVWKRTALRLGYLEESSSCASGLCLGKKSIKELNPVDDPSELSKAILAQNTPGKLHYDDVLSWRQFVKRRWATDHNWRRGTLTSRVIMLGESIGPIHRWKLDIEKGLVVVSGGRTGRYAAHAVRNGEVTWTSRNHEMTFPHVELSEGYFVFALPEHFSIWRRSDITVPDCPTTEFVEPDTTEGEKESTGSDPLLYLPFCKLGNRQQCTATKLRFPHFVAASPPQFTIRHWNISCGSFDEISFREEFNHCHARSVNYIELDNDFIFLASDTHIHIWNLHDGGFAGRFPPSNPILMVPSASAIYTAERLIVHARRGYSAMHHDMKGGHFLAALSQIVPQYSFVGALVWTCNLKKGISDKNFIENTVVLHMPGPITQLSVENGRAAFTCAMWGDIYLYYMNLRQFSDIEDFKRNPIKPTCIANPLPWCYEPQRVEMTSTGIYVDGNRAVLPGGSRHEDWAQLRGCWMDPTEYVWSSLDNSILASSDARRLPIAPLPSSQTTVILEAMTLVGRDRWELTERFRELNVEFGTVWPISSQEDNCILEFSFAPPPEKSEDSGDSNHARELA